MILAIDAGNSRIKWGVREGETWAARGSAPTGDLAGLARDWGLLPVPERIVASNVAGNHVQELITGVASRWQRKIFWLVPTAEQCGVRNGYRDPSQLGSDRWAALIAAWKRYGKSSLVINAGTAMTVDALSGDGEFRGGIIVPGLALMQQALAEHTAALGGYSGRFQEFPKETGDAIHSGAVHALAGAVQRMAVQLERAERERPLCILSGGDAAALQLHLELPSEVVDGLVLEGLARVARADPP